MALAQSKVTAQGQISVPAEIRKRLGLGPGSVLEWDQKGETIIVRRAANYSSGDVHRAIFSKPPNPHTLEDMKVGIARHVKRRHAIR